MFEGPFADTELLRFQEAHTITREVAGVGLVVITPVRWRGGEIGSAWRLERRESATAPTWAKEWFGKLQGECPEDAAIVAQWQKNLENCE